MLGLLDQLPRVQWMITTLGKKGSVLVERASPQDAKGEAVLEYALNNMISEAASGSSSNGAHDSAGHDGHGPKSQAACTSKTQAKIRRATLSQSIHALLDMMTSARASMVGQCFMCDMTRFGLACISSSFMALLLASILFRMTHWMTLVAHLHVLVTCRAGTTLSSSKAFKLCPSTPPEQQQNEAEEDQGSSGQAKTSVVALITVATAAYVPQVSDIDILCRLHHLICSVEGGCS